MSSPEQNRGPILRSRHLRYRGRQLYGHRRSGEVVSGRCDVSSMFPTTYEPALDEMLERGRAIEEGRTG